MVINLNKTTKKIDNTSLVREMLSFPDRNSFYLICLIKEESEGSENRKSKKGIFQNYFVYSLEEFDFLLPRIKNQCQLEKMSAYIKINSRNSKNIAFKMFGRLSDYVVSGKFNEVNDLFARCAEEFGNDSDKKICIEIDWKQWINKAEIEAILVPRIEELQEEAGFDPFCKLIPTKNGVQIVTRPFLLEDLFESYPHLIAQLDGSILLYS